MNDLDRLRQKIDKVDNEIVDALAIRFDVIAEVARLKKLQGIQTVDSKRFNSLVAALNRKAKAKSLPDKMIGELYEIIHRYSIAEQTKQR